MTRLALAASLMLALFGAGCICYRTESPVLVGTDVKTGKPVILDNPKYEASKTCYWDIAPVAGSPGSTRRRAVICYPRVVGRSRLATRIIDASNSGSTGQACLAARLASHPVPTGAISGAIG